MRTACWTILFTAFCLQALACDDDDSELDDRSDAAMDGGTAGTGAEPDLRRPARPMDASIPRPTKPDARVPKPDAAPISEDPDDRDAGDEDGGADGAGIRYEGGDGSSCEQAVIILGASGELAGILAEYRWLDEHYPGAMVLDQALATCDEAYVDILRIRSADGKTIEVYFNIDDFFGT